jgi:hypothetical protein
MAIVGGLDIHRKQITFDYQDTVTGQVRREPGARRWPRPGRRTGQRMARPGAGRLI